MPGQRHLLVRRHRRTGELAYYPAGHPARCPWPSWSGQLGAGGWWRRISRLAMAWPPATSTRYGAAFAGTGGLPWHARAGVPRRDRAGRVRPATATRMVPLTRNEIARLAGAVIIQPGRDARGRLRWPRLVPTSPAHRPGLPLPAASRPGPVKARCRRVWLCAPHDRSSGSPAAESPSRTRDRLQGSLSSCITGEPGICSPGQCVTPRPTACG